jgi:hypothetical protein
VWASCDNHPHAVTPAANVECLWVSLHRRNGGLLRDYPLGWRSAANVGYPLVWIFSIIFVYASDLL